jgi:hypothetical protein
VYLAKGAANMEQIFESECDPEARTSVFRNTVGRVVVIIYAGGVSFTNSLEREDAEAMARAILGIPDPPFIDWDYCAAAMRAQAEIEVLEGAVAWVA